MFTNGNSMGGRLASALGPGEPVSENQRISPRLDPWCFRVVIFGA